jgi:hypothetical protein
LSVKKSLKAGVKAAYDPVGGTKDSIDIAKRDITHKPNIDTSAQDAILEQQRLAQAKLDDEENRRRKKLLAAAQGSRAYRGSPLFRAAPSNTAGAAVAAVAAPGAAAVAGRPTAGSRGGGGARGTYAY